eukprot:GFYU01014012.1.p2 GENE.GFYU01014012.1~~GFYU01014012.1.p2  ORF type:complete len:101 (-),score=20.34 GFYU01014012.1:11-313(-)
MNTMGGMNSMGGMNTMGGMGNMGVQGMPRPSPMAMPPAQVPQPPQLNVSQVYRGGQMGIQPPSHTMGMNVGMNSAGGQGQGNMFMSQPRPTKPPAQWEKF